MFGEIFRFELKQQLRSPLFWMIALAFGALAFAAAGSDSVQVGGGVGNVHRNAPYVITQWLIIFTLLGMFLITVFVAGGALRDFDNGTAELFFATPISRTAYLGGRFTAGYLAAAVVLIFVALGLMTGVLMPWVDPDRLGPTNFAAYGYAFVFFVLPGLFFVSALLFLLATLTRSMLGTYIGIIAFFVLWQIAVITTGNLEHRTLGALIDPFGFGAFELATRYWSAQDRNMRVPEITGILLINRAIWISVGFALIAATFSLFRPDREGLRWRRRKKAVAKTDEAPDARHTLVLPQVTLSGDAAARWSQFLKLAWFDTRGVLRGVALIVMLAFGLINLGGSLAFTNEIFGTKIYPVTHVMTEQLDSSYNFLLFIIIGFYAGELVWRERSAKISEVTDAFPLPDWIPLLSKLVALTTVIVIFLMFGALECVGYQVIRGFYHFEPLLYLSNIALSTLAFVLLAVLALFFQVIANNKFLGYLLIVLFFVSRIALGQLYFDHHLYSYGSAPAALYSDMNGYGHFLAGHLWFRAYWACFAVALLVIAALFWSRGTALGWAERTHIARQRFRHAGTVAAGDFAGRIRRAGRLDFLQHQCDQPVYPARRGETEFRRLREEISAVQGSAAAENHRRERECGYLSARSPRRRRWQVCPREQNGQAHRNSARARADGSESRVRGVRTARRGQHRRRQRLHDLQAQAADGAGRDDGFPLQTAVLEQGIPQ